MKLGFLLGYAGKHINIPIDLIKQAEAMGFDSVWTAEAYGNDAVTAATWVLAQTEKIKVGTAIMQMPARTPAMAAMTSMSLSQLSGGRFIAGLGASGPQVIEGWHGVPYGKPVTRTREYVKIMRAIMAREGPVEFDGQVYQMPNKSEGTTGLGKPLKSILAADPNIPIYTASITPAGLRCAGEVADGVFPVWMDPNKFDVAACGELLIERDHDWIPREAALALGASRWEIVYRVLFPAAKNGLLAASMLGVGRAVGETMAVWMASGGTENIPSGGDLLNFSFLFDRVKALTATIASEMPDTAHGDDHYMMLFVIGLVLLLISVVINVVSDLVIKGVKNKHS